METDETTTMPDPASKPLTFSIRTALLGMLVVGVMLAGLRAPSDTMVSIATMMLIAAVAVSGYCCLRDGTSNHPWILAFAIASICFSLDTYLLPSSSLNAAYDAAHPADAAREAASVASGLNKARMDFDSILLVAVKLLFAATFATILTLMHPRRFPWPCVLILTLIATAGLFVIHDAVTMSVSLICGSVASLACYVVLRDLRPARGWLAAFALSMTSFQFFTAYQTVPDLNLFSTLHSTPPDPMQNTLDRYAFQAMERDCLGLWFGLLLGTAIYWLAKRPLAPSASR